MVAASTLAAATQLGDFNAVAAALRTLIAAAPNVAPNVNDDDDDGCVELARVGRVCGIQPRFDDGRRRRRDRVGVRRRGVGV